MMDYDTLRHLADSWGLLYLMAIFAGAVAVAFRPGARRKHADAALIPFKED
jgi:cytochrome c oxidase cbb3-type subunit 4